MTIEPHVDPCPSGCASALSASRRGIICVPGGLVVCRDCGAEVRAERSPIDKRQAPRPLEPIEPHAPRSRIHRQRRVAPAPKLEHRRIRAYVAEVLWWDAALAKAERAQRGDRSPLWGMLQTLQLGVLGTGCKGTKGIGRNSTPDLIATDVDPLATARFQSLRGDELKTTTIVALDGMGDQEASRELGGPGTAPYLVGLSARVAFTFASDERRDHWRRLRDVWTFQFAERDGLGAIASAAEFGSELLAAAAVAWFGKHTVCADP